MGSLADFFDYIVTFILPSKSSIGISSLEILCLKAFGSKLETSKAGAFPIE